MNQEDTKDKRATHAMVIEKVKGLQIRNLTIAWKEDRVEPKWGSALILKDVKDVTIDSFSGRQGLKTSSAPVIVMENVSDGIIRNSAALEGTKTFVHISGSETHDLVFQSNQIRKAQTGITYESDRLKKTVDVK